jgi:hypothetical protein
MKPKSGFFVEVELGGWAHCKSDILLQKMSLRWQSSSPPVWNAVCFRFRCRCYVKNPSLEGWDLLMGEFLRSRCWSRISRACFVIKKSKREAYLTSYWRRLVWLQLVHVKSGGRKTFLQVDLRKKKRELSHAGHLKLFPSIKRSFYSCAF